MKAYYEYTDTFAREPNYSWVERGEVTAKTERGIIAAAKKAVRLNGDKCRKTSYNDTIELRPYGMARVLFISFTNE